MNKDLAQREEAIRYLLGDVSETERDRIEERFFADEQFSLLLDDAENDLIDDYARGSLGFEEKRKFERNFLTTERRREKTRLASLQTEVFAAPKEEKIAVSTDADKPLWQAALDFFRLPRFAFAGALAAILLLFLMGGLWLVRQPEEVQVVQTENENQPQTADLPTPAPATNESQLTSQNDNVALPPIKQKPELKEKPAPRKIEPEKPDIARKRPQPSNFFVAFTLLPPTRSSERQILIVPRQAETIRLRVAHDSAKEFVRYRVEIRDSSGDLIWSREIPVNSGNLQKPIPLNVRSGALASGAYELTLSGATADRRLEEINFYNFIVQKKK
jgi:hypothetical protein